jgi:hypothetical protein
MTKKIDSREQLLSHIVKHIVYVYIKRAIHNGPVENLGAFLLDDIKQPHKGWIVKVTTQTKRIVFISVMVNEGDMSYRLNVLEEINWRQWIGDSSKNKLYLGDNPEIYSIAREQEIRKNGTH